ncbi:ribbon-helix-helix domain-containing protein [Nocardioides sp. AE5]|uniref:ribbon-helix-helix domain-containing protein n=1 Tax=Nocardioides sp. AE5 TaxID=2962573 RepID=UPI002882B80E|nr:ribbon-helix-helix domain-containing protein [Nocardioides sp. AE5]MDT0202935.1 ribbon-helix-helix domain-containing protein [Nocardioides sp. AE5]
MSTQIAVRLPDDLVEWIDDLVRSGAGSRAAVTAKALRRYRRQLEAEHDAAVYRDQGGYPDLEEWAGQSRTFPEID